MRRSHLTLAVVVAALPTLAFGQSLAEAARKEQERRAKATAAPKVLDDDALKSNNGQIANAASVATPVVTSAPAPPVEASLAQDQAARRANEQYWRSQASQRRGRVEGLERDLKQAERWCDPTYAGADAPS